MNGMRRIEQRNAKGDVTGVFQTTLTDVELAERDRQTAERRDALLAQNSSVMSEARRVEQAEREALAGIGVDDSAREHLRAAHHARAAACDELARRREVVAAAEAHVERCEAAAAAAQQVLDGIAERAASAIVEQLEQGHAPKTASLGGGGPPTPTANASREKAEAARADLEHAITARAEVAGLVGPAEKAVTEAEAHLKEAARGVIRLRMFELRAEIDALNAQLEARRERINALLPTLTERRWAVPWPADAAALLADPEASLDLDMSSTEDAAA